MEFEQSEQVAKSIIGSTRFSGKTRSLARDYIRLYAEHQDLRRRAQEFLNEREVAIGRINNLKTEKDLLKREVADLDSELKGARQKLANIEREAEKAKRDAAIAFDACRYYKITIEWYEDELDKTKADLFIARKKLSMLPKNTNPLTEDSAAANKGGKC